LDAGTATARSDLNKYQKTYVNAVSRVIEKITRPGGANVVRELFTGAASAKAGASKQLAPHYAHLFLKDHLYGI